MRIGRGPQALATPVVPPQTRPLDELEPLCASALRRFVLTYSVVPELPVAMAVNGFGRVHVLGPPERRRSLARAVVAQLAVHHSPDDLLVAVGLVAIATPFDGSSRARLVPWWRSLAELRDGSPALVALAAETAANARIVDGVLKEIGY